jgi:hypothetical protein
MKTKYWNRIARFLLLAAFASLPFWRPFALEELFWFYLLLFAGGTLRIWANGTIDKGLRVTREGPYALVRHPMYIGTLFVAAGWLLLWCSPREVVAGAGVLALLEIWRAALEESRLLRRFGEEYRSYMRDVPMLLPTPGSFLRGIRTGAVRRGFSWERLWVNGEMPRMLGGLLACVGVWLYWEYRDDTGMTFRQILADEGSELLLGAMTLCVGFALGRSAPGGVRMLAALWARWRTAKKEGREVWHREPPGVLLKVRCWLSRHGRPALLGRPCASGTLGPDAASKVARQATS